MSVETTVNTTDVIPTTSWNADGPNVGFYCNTEDVISLCLGAELSRIDSMLRSGEIPGLLYTDLPDWVSRKLIPTAESEAESIMRVSYRPTQVTKMLDGSGRTTLMLPNRPIISVDKCRITQTPASNYYTFTAIKYTDILGNAPPEYFANADLLCYTQTGRLQIPPRVTYNDQSVVPWWNYTFIPGVQNIMVTWTYGYASSADVPQDIRNAVARLAAIALLQVAGQTSLSGMSEVRFANSSRMAGRNMNMPYSDLIKDYRAEAKRALGRRKQVGI